MNKEQQFKNLFNFIVENRNIICTESEKKGNFQNYFNKQFVQKIYDNFENIFGISAPDFAHNNSLEKNYNFGDFLSLGYENLYFWFETNSFKIIINSFDIEKVYGYYKDSEKRHLYIEYIDNKMKEFVFDQYYIPNISKYTGNIMDNYIVIIKNYSFPKCISVNIEDDIFYKNLIKMDGQPIDPFVIELIQNGLDKYMQQMWITKIILNKKEFFEQYIKEIENKFRKEIKDFTEEDKFYFKMKYCWQTRKFFV